MADAAAAQPELVQDRESIRHAGSSVERYQAWLEDPLAAALLG